MATILFSLAFTPESQAAILRYGSAPQRVAAALGEGVERVLTAAENQLMLDLSGPAGAGRGGATPVGLRSGALRAAATHLRDKPLGGYVGTREGPTQKYARAILGPDATTIKPVNADHLWIPVADNLGPTLQPRMSPTEFFQRGGRVFRSKRGNLVAFLADAKGGRYQRGSKKGQLRGKLLFVLKDQVTVQGTDALRKAVEKVQPRAAEIFNAAIVGSLT